MLPVSRTQRIVTTIVTSVAKSTCNIPHPEASHSTKKLNQVTFPQREMDQGSVHPPPRACSSWKAECHGPDFCRALVNCSSILRSLRIPSASTALSQSNRQFSHALRGSQRSLEVPCPVPSSSPPSSCPLLEWTKLVYGIWLTCLHDFLFVPFLRIVNAWCERISHGQQNLYLY